MPSREEEAVSVIAEKARENGGSALLVGGCVRDRLLKKKANDFDVEVFGLSHEKLSAILSSSFKVDMVGSSFGVFKLHGLNVDVALPRRETKLSLGHKAFSVEYDSKISVREAAARRDFTINAIYMDPITGEIIDPWNGAEDLTKGILRHVSEHFVEDPLRVLRGMQFAARFSFLPAPETVSLCRTMESENLPPERLFGEWQKMLVKGKKISAGLSFLRETNWVRYYPELERLIGCEQEKAWHPEGDVWNHTLHCLDAYASMRPDNTDTHEETIVGFAVLCHDFGKPKATFYDPVKKKIRSVGHDELGVEPTLSFLSRLTNEESILKEVPPLVRFHMRPFAMWKDKSSDGAVRRLAAKVGRIDRLLRVAAADDAGRPPYPSEPEHLEWLRGKALQLEVADSKPQPMLMGRDLIRRGMKPGVKFGEILKKCYEAQLDGVFSDDDGAQKFLDELLKGEL
jgi:tRNA nucleotidyltransferase (CCA-adding enzyme)